MDADKQWQRNPEMWFDMCWHFSRQRPFRCILWRREGYPLAAEINERGSLLIGTMDSSGVCPTSLPGSKISEPAKSDFLTTVYSTRKCYA